MRVLSIEQQIAALRPTLWFAAHMHRWFLVGAGLGVVAAVSLWHPAPLMFSFFLALVGISEQSAGPNIVAAIHAYDTDAPTLGEVTISIASGSDDDQYRARVREPDHPDWEFEFIPQGWRPAEQTYPARIWRNVEQRPVLAVVTGGIIIPRDKPKPVPNRG